MLSFASVLQAGSIRLLVGDKEFVVHRKLVEHNLNYLHISSRDRYVDIEGDEHSAGYLLEYLYTGDYTPSTTHQEQSPYYDEEAPRYSGASDQDVAVPVEGEIHPMVLAARTSGLGIWGRPAALHTKFHHEVLPTKLQESPPIVVSDYPHPASITAASNAAVATSGTGGPDIASTFLIHAKVYLLAERYGFSSLQDFSLQKLRAALKTSEIEPAADQTASSVIVIRDIYELPRQQGGMETVQKLRDIVVTHAVSQLHELQANKDFAAYVKEGGDFVTDLLSSLTTSRLSLH
ncbi:MAG: hypothetical protein M1830_007458 [Pleopsidium flavum]|nr:MAG: hypothetical protein M1830_007458 [Pleopsidium flavum]